MNSLFTFILSRVSTNPPQALARSTCTYRNPSGEQLIAEVLAAGEVT